MQTPTFVVLPKPISKRKLKTESYRTKLQKYRSMLHKYIFLQETHSAQTSAKTNTGIKTRFNIGHDSNGVVYKPSGKCSLQGTLAINPTAKG